MTPVRKIIEVVAVIVLSLRGLCRVYPHRGIMLDALRIPVVTVPENGLAVAETIAVKALTPPNVAPLPANEAAIEGVLSEVGGEYLFAGYVRCTYHGTCHRCLAEAENVAEIDVMWHFATTVEDDIPHLWDGEDDDEEEEEAQAQQVLPWRVTGGIVHLDEPLWEELAMTEPVKMVCREACKGLCSRCGANLNEGPCGCENEETPEPGTHKGLAKLADLYPDLAKKPTEE